MTGQNVEQDNELLRMKLVDRVVPFNKLKQTAFELAQRYTCQPSSSLAAVKRLVDYSLKDLKYYLEKATSSTSCLRIPRSRSFRITFLPSSQVSRES